MASSLELSLLRLYAFLRALRLNTRSARACRPWLTAAQLAKGGQLYLVSNVFMLGSEREEGSHLLDKGPDVAADLQDEPEVL
ncbi:hypothetical protein GCM10022252_36290 [Streptosporangium oxazolinicum]|uniref:Uncharacterized protein n=1 Tax=Streptosporangium oxazolinicum TaxID=909287 RepID=A0ABP8AY62_9ACTN